jgi:hypothetical protein
MDSSLLSPTQEGCVPFYSARGGLVTSCIPDLPPRVGRRRVVESCQRYFVAPNLSYGPPWAHYLGGYQDRLLGGPLGLPGLRYTAPEGVEHKDNTGVVLG